MNMNLSREVGEPLIKAFEGCLKAVPGRPGFFTTYYCPANVLTIGWGTTRSDAPNLVPGEVWPQAKCDQMFTAGMGKYERHALKQLSGATVTQSQFDALTSWAYNCGGPASSAVWTYARKGDIEATCARLERWNKGGGRVLPGLVRRRKAECELYRGNVDAALRTAGTKRGPAGEPTGRATDRPTPPAAEVAKQTKRETATLATGTTMSGSGGAAKASGQKTFGLAEGAVVVGGVAVAVGIVLLVRKVRAVRADWA